MSLKLSYYEFNNNARLLYKNFNELYCIGCFNTNINKEYKFASYLKYANY